MRSRWTHSLLVMLMVVTTLVAIPATASADPNFTESETCGAAGYRGPLAETGGWLPLSAEIYGPWADFFGRNGYSVSNQMVSWTPYRSSRTVPVHSRALPAFQLVNQNLAGEYARGNYYPVTVAYGHAFRAVTGGSHRMSFHAFGTAVDINPSQNPYNADDPPVLVTDMPAWYVKAWEDAGFCWGGYWESIKDAMHFSWMGPSATPGYPATPVDHSPVTTAIGYRTVGFTGATASGAGDWQYDVVDRSRDGAPDIYAWRWAGPGEIRLEVASAFGDFQDIGVRENITVAGASGTHGVTFADFDGDSRADLWVVDWATDVVTVYGDTVGEADRFTQVLAQHTLGVTNGAVLMGGDFNRDRVLEAYVVDGNGVLTILNGVGGFQNVLVQAATGARPAWNRFDLGDYDGDGALDLYAVSKVSQQVYVANGFGTGFVNGPYWSSLVPQSGQIQVGDYDGDGRGDIYHFDAGMVSVYLGGVRSPGTDLQGWFDHPDLSPWDAGPECIGAYACEKVGYVTGSLEFNLRDNLSWEGGEYHEFFFGIPGDQPLMGDWNGNGVSTPGMFRPSTGFAYVANTNATQIAPIEFFFGIGGDKPLAGDWDGDGKDSLSIYRPSEGRFYVSNLLQTQFAEASFNFSLPGSVPFAGDFNGDGLDDLGLYRASDGYVVMRFMGSAGPPDASFYVGSNAQTVIAGDWSGDGTDTVAWHNDAEGRYYFRLANTQGAADHVLRAGPEGGAVTPIVGTWTIIS
ncbi:MAG: FG-GAP-like repeat-containing protein [Acidimicrobiia bacterium]